MTVQCHSHTFALFSTERLPALRLLCVARNLCVRHVAITHCLDRGQCAQRREHTENTKQRSEVAELDASDVDVASVLLEVRALSRVLVVGGAPLEYHVRQDKHLSVFT